MKVLVIGNGGRESAIVRTLSKSSKVSQVFASPGNVGMLKEAKLLEFKSFQDTYNEIVNNRIDLVIVGPEQYLSEGIVDYLSERKVPVIGPTKQAAMLESSKVYAKEQMQRYNIPTAEFASFTSLKDAQNYIKKAKYPLVIKADGLAAGKGVVIADNYEQASNALVQMMEELAFGNAGARVVIEEYLVGWEGSVFAFTDGDDYKLTIFSQDHKRILDGDLGANTGGMGAYAPLDLAAPYIQEIEKSVFQPLFNGLKKEGVKYQGILYAGMIFTEKGPYVLEYNCRLGDPETQAVLPLLKTDFIDICEAIDSEQIRHLNLEWSDQYAVNIVAASQGYPDKYDKGKLITVDPKLYDIEGVELFYANVAKKDNSDNLYTDGGRVLSLTALAESLDDSIVKAYSAMDLIHFENMYYRKDIARNRS